MKYEGKNDQHQMMYLFVLFERKPSMYPEFATLTSRSKKNCLSSNLGRSLDSTDFLATARRLNVELYSESVIVSASVAVPQ